MKLIDWLLFLATQLLVIFLLLISNPKPIMAVGFVLLHPSSGILYLVGGDALAHAVMRSTFSQATAIVIFFSINLAAWLLVTRLLYRRKTARSV